MMGAMGLPVVTGISTSLFPGPDAAGGPGVGELLYRCGGSAGHGSQRMADQISGVSENRKFAAPRKQGVHDPDGSVIRALQLGRVRPSISCFQCKAHLGGLQSPLITLIWRRSCFIVAANTHGASASMVLPGLLYHLLRGPDLHWDFQALAHKVAQALGNEWEATKSKFMNSGEMLLCANDGWHTATRVRTID